MLLAILVAGGCGAGPTTHDMDRSMHEFRLADALRKEGNVPGALEHLRLALELDPENGVAHVLLGYIHLMRQDYDRAEQNLEAGLRVLGQKPDMASALAEARNLMGVVRIHQGRYDEAIELLRASASDMLNGAPWYAWGNLGWAYYEKQDYEASLEALTEAVRVQPRFCLGHFMMGRTYFATEQFEEAETALTRALEADQRCEQHYQEAWRLRGETRARLGHRQEAISDFERCAELGRETAAGEACVRFLDTGS